MTDGSFTIEERTSSLVIFDDDVGLFSELAARSLARSFGLRAWNFAVLLMGDLTFLMAGWRLSSPVVVPCRLPSTLSLTIWSSSLFRW